MSALTLPESSVPAGHADRYLNLLMLAYGWHKRGLPEPHALSDAEVALVAFTADEYFIAPDVFRAVAADVREVLAQRLSGGKGFDHPRRHTPGSARNSSDSMKPSKLERRSSSSRTWWSRACAAARSPFSTARRNALSSSSSPTAGSVA